jgi:hypothetical protein
MATEELVAGYNNYTNNEELDNLSFTQFDGEVPETSSPFSCLCSWFCV